MRRFGWLGLLWIGILSGCGQAPLRPPSQAPRGVSSIPRWWVAIPDADHDVVAQILLGESALSHNELRLAAQAYFKAAQLSTTPAVAERATELALAIHDQAMAGQALQRWHQLGGAADTLAQADATVALAQGDLVAAINDCRRLVATRAAHAWERLVRVLLSAPDPMQAGQVLAAVAQPARLPADSQTWIAMSSLAAKLGQTAVAQQLAEQAVQRFHNPASYAWAGQWQFEHGQPQQAHHLFELALQQDPHNPRWRLLYAGLLSQHGATRQAASLLANGPQSAQIYGLRIALAAQAHQTGQLQLIYRQLSQAAPSVQRQSAYMLGQLAELLGRPVAALDWYGQVADDDPHAFDADFRTAIVEADQSRIDDAHAQLASMQADYLDQPAQLRQIDALDAALYMRQRRYAEAADAYTEALAAGESEPELIYDRGIAEAAAGRVDAALADFRQVLQLKPGDIDSSNALGFTLADHQRDLNEALSLLQYAHQARPNDPVINDSWGWLQYRLGHLAAAEQALRVAWRAQPDPDIGVHLAEVLWRQGQQAEARQLFQQIRQQDPNNPTLQASLGRLKP